MSNISPTSIESQSELKSNTYPVNPVLFILSAHQSFEIFPRYDGLVTISESFALNL